MTVSNLKQKIDFLFGRGEKNTKFTLLSDMYGYGFEIPVHRIRKSAIQEMQNSGFIILEKEIASQAVYQIFTGDIL